METKVNINTANIVELQKIIHMCKKRMDDILKQGIACI